MQAVVLYIRDAPVLSSLQFALAVEGILTIDGAAEGPAPSAAAALVIDQEFDHDGLALLQGLRARGCTAPAIVLSTHPTAVFRARAAAAGATLVEKPLSGDDLTAAIAAAIDTREAA